MPDADEIIRVETKDGGSYRLRTPARGAGLARLLLERAIADAAAEGLKIAPYCSYAATVMERRPDWRAMIALA